MASADFSQFVVTAHFLCVCETSPGKNEIFPLICLPHLQQLLPCGYWTSAFLGALSTAAALYAISVRPAKGLLTASFRFCLTTDTLAVQLCTSHHRACSGLSPIRFRPCRALFHKYLEESWLSSVSKSCNRGFHRASVQKGLYKKSLTLNFTI